MHLENYKVLRLFQSNDDRKNVPPTFGTQVRCMMDHISQVSHPYPPLEDVPRLLLEAPALKRQNSSHGHVDNEKQTLQAKLSKRSEEKFRR